MAKVLMAAFDSTDHANDAITELEESGISTEDISIITKAEESDETIVKNADGDEVAQDTTAGALSGATTGGAVGGLAGLLAGAGIFPALAGLFIGGPIAAALGLTGMAATAVSGAVTGAAAGGVVGALTGAGVSAEKAETYADAVNAGGIILGIPADREDIADARQILEDNGAHDIDEFELKS